MFYQETQHATTFGVTLTSHFEQQSKPQGTIFLSLCSLLKLSLFKDKTTSFDQPQLNGKGSVKNLKALALEWLI